MPSRIERRTVRWLLRVALLGTIIFAIWDSLSSWYYPQKARIEQAANAVQGAASGSSQDARAAPGAPVKPEGRNSLVVVSLKDEDPSWLDAFHILEGWERNVYIVDGEALKASAKLKIPKNKGREGMVYLSFIIDNYDNLPNITIFLHSARYQWHNDDPLYDGVPILRKLRISHVEAEGYANLRCGWTLGCPSEIQPGRNLSGDARTEPYYTEAFKVLFPNNSVPEIVGVGCCAQFAATRSQIRLRPLSDYVRFRQWLLETPLEDYVSGRIMEYSWHIILGKAPVHCPLATDCYCNTYGLCNLTCTEGSCEGRYILPPFATMPKEWPRIGWKGEDTGIEGLKAPG